MDVTYERAAFLFDKGVYWDSARWKWHAQISIHNHSKSLGRYSDIREAQAAYAAAVHEQFGDFARLD